MQTISTAQPRALVLVDFENLHGGSILTVNDARTTMGDIKAALSENGMLLSDHQVIVASGRTSAPNAGLALQGARFLFGDGLDAADLALLKVLEDENIGQRYERVVLVSGDGIFASAIAALGAQGVSTYVVSRPESLSRRLRMAAHHHFLITTDTIPSRRKAS